VWFSASSLPLHGQAISGILTEKATGEPLVWTSVVLLDEAFQPVDSTRTQFNGEYVLYGALPGRWYLQVHRLGHLQFISDPVDVPEGGRVRVNLALDLAPVAEVSARMDSLSAEEEALRLWLNTECAGVVGSQDHALLLGVVTDSITGVPVPGIPARILWSPDGAPVAADDREEGQSPWGSGRAESRSVVTGLGGLFLFCDVPANTQVVLEAGVGQRMAETVTLTLPPGSVHREDLEFPLSNVAEPGNIMGRIRDADTRDPVEFAEVKIRDTGFSTLTNILGHFSIKEVPFGIYVLEVDHLAYGHTEHPFRVMGGMAQEIDLTLSQQAIPLDPIRVEVHSNRWFRDQEGLRHRQVLGFGTILTREELETRGNSTRLSDLLQGLPGVRVRKQGLRSMVQLRNAVRLRGGRFVPCPPTVYVDGIIARLDPDVGFDDYVAGEIQALEVYSGPASVPGEFTGGADPGCGAVVIWTRR
jgi:hypothetical protein